MEEKREKPIYMCTEIWKQKKKIEDEYMLRNGRSTPISSVPFQPKSFKKLQTITVMRIKFLLLGAIAFGMKVVWKVE